MNFNPSCGNPNESCVEYGDPGFLEVIGAIAQALGLAEQIQRIVPMGRIESRSRHNKIDRKLSEFKDGLDEARGALRLIKTVIEGKTT